MPAPTQPKDLHPELRAVLERHRSATEQLKRDAHDALGPIIRLTGQIERHLQLLEEELAVAELAAHDHALDGSMEFLHARVRGTREAEKVFRDIARTLGLKLTELAQGFDDYQQRVALAGPGFAPEAVGAPVQESSPALS